MGSNLTINGFPLKKSFTFPDGVNNIQLPLEEINNAYEFQRIEKQFSLDIKTKIKSANDVIELLLVSEAIDYYFPYQAKNLTINYFPYARQDRRCNEVKMKLFNANLKTVNEAMKRMIDGEVFYSSVYHSSMYFDKKFLNSNESPFRYKFRDINEPIIKAWNGFTDWLMYDDWENHIGEGVLCWVWNDNTCIKRMELFIKFDKYGKMPISKSYISLHISGIILEKCRTCYVGRN